MRLNRLLFGDKEFEIAYTLVSGDVSQGTIKAGRPPISCIAIRFSLPVSYHVSCHVPKPQGKDGTGLR